MHWYDSNGNPAYEIKGANGKMRPTTLRDARTLDLVPSVTTIMSVQDKPGLLTWLKNEIINATFNNPFDPLFDDEITWKRKVIEESKKNTEKAQKYGTAIHDALEQALLGNGVKPEMESVCTPVLEFLFKQFPDAEWVTEKSFTHKLGFGGCVDLHCHKTNIVLDFKTKMKPSEYIEKIKAYDEQHMQTAAYCVGLNMPKESERYNLFVGYEINEEDQLVHTGIKLTESTDFEREWGMFETLTKFWQLKNKYVPRGII